MLFTDKMRIQIDKYLKCQGLHIRNPANINFGILENEGSGYEHLQLFKNDFDISKLDYEDICNLSWLLTRSLRAQVNRDQYVFWTWCGFIANYFRNNLGLLKNPHNVLKDHAWIRGFNSILSILLLKQYYKAIDSPFWAWFGLNRYNISGPLGYTLLEGLL